MQQSKGDLPAAADPIDGQTPSLPTLSDQLAGSDTMLPATTEQSPHRLEAPLHQDPALTSLPASAGLTTANSTTPNLNNTTAMTLATPVGSSEWQQGLGQQLVGLYQRGDKQIDLHLHPADLGPLSISLKLAESGVQAQFIAAHPQVRAAVEQALPELRAALASQGISLGEASVGGQQQPQRDTQDNPASNSHGATITVTDNLSSLPEQLPLTPIPLGNGRVDLYA
jgi:flagellar hook-length control protein FliK